MRGRLGLIGKFLLIVFIIAIVIFIWESLPLITGYDAKVACSAVFVSGRRLDGVMKEEFGRFPMSLASCAVNEQDSSVTASIWGMASRKAVYRRGLGATLVSGMTEEQLRDQRIQVAVAPVVEQGDNFGRGAGRGGAADSGWVMVGEGRKGLVDSGLAAAGVDRGGAGRGPMADSGQLMAAVGLAFGEGGEAASGTRAVVILRGGKLLMERYAEGFDKNTRLAGWSMTKGVVNALVGILVGQGKLKVDQGVSMEGWAGDDRRAITVADLLHMNSGLKWWEWYAGPGDATRMLFKEADMGGFAALSSLRHPPGQTFNYSSGTANILSLLIRQTIDDQNYYRWPYEQLFFKAGMYSAVLEPDASGTFVGSSYCYATARDWARFGELYLDDGVCNGQRVLPAGWVSYTTSGTSSYGALWWRNTGGCRYAHVPGDCFSCEGYEGQYIWVIPSKDLVVVRLALQHGHRLNADRFLQAVIGALK